MIKQNKLSKSILAFVIMLLCNLHSWAQAERTVKVSADSKPHQKEASAAVELKNFEYDASNPELSDQRLLLLKTKVDLEYRQSQNRLSEQEIAYLKESIVLLENKVNFMSKNNTNVVAGKTYTERKFTREQFVAMSEADQKEIVSNPTRYEITDLINAAPGAERMENVIYITVDDFKDADAAKKIHMIKNSSSYVILKDASSFPLETQVVTKYRMSRAEFNTFPSDKQRDILNSDHIEITD